MTVTLSTSSPLKHSATVAIALMMFAAALPRSADAQTRPADSGERQVPTTVHGHPDLQGNWTNATLTPLQRPAGWEPVLTWDKVTEIDVRLETEDPSVVIQDLRDGVYPSVDPGPGGSSASSKSDEASSGGCGGAGGSAPLWPAALALLALGIIRRQ